MGKNKISISIAGHEFIVSTEEEREYTLRLANTVDTKIRGIINGNTKLNFGMAAILSCLDFCDENEKNKAACARLREEMRDYLLQLEAATDLQRKLQHENELLRQQLAQYEMGQIGFNS
jgi:cell division protein ZapA